MRQNVLRTQSDREEAPEPIRVMVDDAINDLSRLKRLAIHRPKRWYRGMRVALHSLQGRVAMLRALLKEEFRKLHDKLTHEMTVLRRKIDDIGANLKLRAGRLCPHLTDMEKVLKSVVQV